MTNCEDRRALATHRGVVELTSMRGTRRTMLEKVFFKPVKLKGPAVTLGGGPRSRFKCCKCPYVSGMYSDGSKLLRSLQNPYGGEATLMSNLFKCPACETNPMGARLAVQFAERLAAAECERSALCNLAKRAAHEACQQADLDGAGGDREDLALGEPHLCYIKEIQDVDCSVKPGFAYRSLMRRLRETRERTLGIYEEDEITRDSGMKLAGKIYCTVGVQTLTQADGRLWPGEGRVLWARAGGRCCTRPRKTPKRTKTTTAQYHATVKSAMFRVKNKISDFFIDSSLKEKVKEKTDKNDEKPQPQRSRRHHHRQHKEKPPKPNKRDGKVTKMDPHCKQTSNSDEKTSSTWHHSKTRKQKQTSKSSKQSKQDVLTKSNQRNCQNKQDKVLSKQSYCRRFKMVVAFYKKIKGASPHSSKEIKNPTADKHSNKCAKKQRH